MTTSCDHNLLSFTVEGKIVSEQKPEVKIPFYDKGNYSKMVEELERIDWDPGNMHQFNVQSYYNDFISCLQDLIEKYVPKA